MWARIAGVSLLAGLGCGSQDRGEPPDEPDRRSARTAAARAPIDEPPPLEPLVMGKADLTAYAYSLGPGRADFQRGNQAAGARDWAAAEAACRDSLLRDPGHLEAHWILAVSLAAQERHDEALDPLSAAVAGDWQRWGERSLTEEDLSDFRASPAGKRYLQLADSYRRSFRAAVQSGLLLVGRRGKVWGPRRTGATTINHRSELYAYDLGSGRYLRVSRTDGSLVGILRAPAGNELAFVSYRKVWLPPRAGAAAPPLIRELDIGTIDLDSGRMSPAEARLTDVRRLDLFYETAEGGAPRLLARVVGKGGAESLYEIDAQRGQASRTAPADQRSATDALRVEYDLVTLHRAGVDGVAADWDQRGSAGSFRLMNTRKTITVPGGDSAVLGSLRWSPSRSRLSFATRAAAPCSDEPAERAATLYVVDAATGRLRPVVVGEGPFDAVWVDEDRLAYVSRSGDRASLRLVDINTSAELVSLEAAGGIGTDWLAAPTRCPSGPPQAADEPAAEEDEEE